MEPFVLMIMGVLMVFNIIRSLYLRYRERNAFEQKAREKAIRKQQQILRAAKAREGDMHSYDPSFGDPTDTEKVSQRFM